MTEDVGEIFAVVAEFKNQGPILMETEGPMTSRSLAYDRMDNLLRGTNVLRAAVVRITYSGGNELLVHDMKRMQE